MAVTPFDPLTYNGWFVPVGLICTLLEAAVSLGWLVMISRLSTRAELASIDELEVGNEEGFRKWDNTARRRHRIGCWGSLLLIPIVLVLAGIGTRYEYRLGGIHRVETHNFRGWFSCAMWGVLLAFAPVCYFWPTRKAHRSPTSC